MAHGELPRTSDEITPEWLSSVLRERGLLRDARVVDIDGEVLGEGQGFVGDVIRYRLELDRPEEDAPRSLIAKLPTTTSRKNRGFAQMNGIYEKEIRFYREFAERVGARTPKHYYSALDETPGVENGEAVARFIEEHLPHWLIRMLVVLVAWLSGFNVRRYVLLMEDVAPAEVGDQVGGCSLGDARLALRTLAGIHATFWNSPELEAKWWVAPADLIARSTQRYYVRGLRPFLEKYGDALSAETRVQLDWLRDHGEVLLRRLAGPPFSLLHGDYRLDNLFLDRRRGDVVVGDWQTPLQGLPAMDVAYFLSGSLATDVSDRDEDALLDAYHGALVERGVADYDRAALRADYRRCLLLVLQRLVLTESDLVDIGGLRGEALLTGWRERTARRLAGVDLDALVAAPG